MEDRELIELYWTRSETAISESDIKYGKYLRYIANNILHNYQDSEECVNDTYLRAWKSIPPERPDKPAVFLGKITRNLALDKYRKTKASKRGGGEFPISLEELNEYIGSLKCTDEVLDHIVLKDIFNSFLKHLPKSDRIIFMRKYWYFCSIKEISEDMRISQSKVKMSLLRSRSKLKSLLEKEGDLL